MPSRIDSYRRQCAFSHGYRQAMIADLSDAELRFQPQPGATPILWHYAHAHLTEASIFLGFGAGHWQRIPKDWWGIFGMGAKLPEAIADLPGLDEIQATVSSWHEECLTWLCSLSPQALDQPLPRMKEGMLPEFLQTPAAGMLTLPVHDGHHNGEISLLRRLQGKPGLA